MIHPVSNVLRSHRILHNHPWKEKERRKRRKGAKRAETAALHSKSIQDGAFDIPHASDRMPLNEHSFQDALRTFFQPIKNDDPRLDFYTIYKREATEYDADYVQKYDGDLNTTLIFVSCVSFTPMSDLTRPRRRVCSLLSVPPSPSTSIRGYSLIRTSNPQFSSAQSSSPSINQLSRTKPPPFHLFKNVPPARLSPPLVSCTRVS